MVKFVGTVDVPGILLQYYVFGNRKSGYGIRISQLNGETVQQYISRNLFKVLALAEQMRRCSVFPLNLCEIIDDLQFNGKPD